MNVVPARDASRSNLRGRGKAPFASRQDLKTVRATTHPQPREHGVSFRMRFPSNGMPRKAPEANAESPDVKRGAVTGADAGTPVSQRRHGSRSEFTCVKRRHGSRIVPNGPIDNQEKSSHVSSADTEQDSANQHARSSRDRFKDRATQHDR